jgi:hypothetical protein
MAYSAHKRELDGSRNTSACCPTGANGVLFQSNVRPLRPLYADLVLPIIDVRMILSTVSICGMNRSHTYIGQTGLIVQSMTMV